MKQLTDVDAVFVSRIGPGAAKSLEDRGVRAFALSGPVDRALTAYGKRHRLIKGKTRAPHGDLLRSRMTRKRVAPFRGRPAGRRAVAPGAGNGERIQRNDDLQGTLCGGRKRQAL